MTRARLKSNFQLRNITFLELFPFKKICSMISESVIIVNESNKKIQGASNCLSMNFYVYKQKGIPGDRVVKILFINIS